MFKPENRKDTVVLITGYACLIAGIVVMSTALSFALSVVANPAGFLVSQIPDEVRENATAGPRASFRFTVTDLSVDVTDESQQGDAGIVSWDWDFGDGFRTNVQSPSYSYSGNFSGFIRLVVRDSVGKESSAVGNVQVFMGASSQGNSMVDPGDIAGSLDFGSVLAPVLAVIVGAAAVIAAFFFSFIVWLVGASLTKAGWNLIKPKSEMIKIRIRPKHLEAEPVVPAQAAPTYAAPQGYAPQGYAPQEPGVPPPPP